jgi:hypothetical protein
MRARQDVSGRGDRLPAGLVTFDGRGFTTVEEWDEAEDAWLDAREAWQAEHPGARLPEERQLGRNPLEIQLFSTHPGGWDWVDPDNGLVRCREHGLTPGEH